MLSAITRISCPRLGGWPEQAYPQAEENEHTSPVESDRQAGLIESGDELSGCQIVPGRTAALQLEHSAFIRMEEIFPAGNPVSVLRTNHAARPTSGGHASPVLFLRGNHVDAIIYTILDSRGPSRN